MNSYSLNFQAGGMTMVDANRKFVIITLSFTLGSLLLFGCMNYLIDPFGMNHRFNFGLDKAAVSLPSNQRLYKVLAFTKKPLENIILGDSRMDGIDTRMIRQITGQPYFNFAFGGGTAVEIIETFWFAAHRTQLKNVYLGMNFNLYNQYNSRNLVHEAMVISGHPEQYYLSFFTAKISFYNLYYKISGINPVNKKPRMGKAEFWSKQLRDAAFFYRHYAYPSQTYRELKQIRDYCRSRNINLVFVIPPTHMDLQHKVKEFHLSGEYLKYKLDLASISRVIDFDYPNHWTWNENLFLDPYHGTEFIKTEMVKEIWGQTRMVGKEL